MQLAFGWYNIIELLFCLVALWMGIRDLQGKDPPIHTFFNQYDSDPEYRAMWQKKKRRVGDLQRNGSCFFAVSGRFPYPEQRGTHHYSHR